MAKKKNVLGAWAFLIGVILAVLFGFVQPFNGMVLILALIGIIIGLFNIAEEEVQPFLFGGVSLVIVSALSGNIFSGVAFLARSLTNILAIFVPATVIVAHKSVFKMARR